MVPFDKKIDQNGAHRGGAAWAARPTVFFLCGSQVWDFNRSAEMRDTEGGASKRSVLEQVAKMRKHLKET